MADDTQRALSTQIQSLGSVVQERIQAEFTRLIPDNVWQGLVESELKRFTSQEHKWSGASDPSPLSRAVFSELETELRKRLKVYFESPEWQSEWDGQAKRIPSMIGTIVKENAGQMIENFLAGIVSGQIDSLRYSMNQR